MDVDYFVKRYPNLWHMADPRNIAGILDRGLLSTSALLDLYGVVGAQRLAIETERRADTIPIEHDVYPTAYIRDQKPLSMTRIENTLTDATAEEFLRFINRRVFFWPNEGRLSRMNGSPAYRDRAQVVFVIPTASMVASHAKMIRLSPMNSGATRPYAFPRSIEMFRGVEEFDRAKRADPVAEITVEGKIPDAMRLVERIELWKAGNRVRTLRRPYDASLLNRVGKA